MASAIDATSGSVSDLRRTLEQWFDGTMDRVSGWYKRSVGYRLLLIGGLAAVLFNVDAITVAQRLSRDEGLRDRVMAQAESTLASRAADQQAGDAAGGNLAPDASGVAGETSPDGAEGGTSPDGAEGTGPDGAEGTGNATDAAAVRGREPGGAAVQDGPDGAQAAAGGDTQAAAPDMEAPGTTQPEADLTAIIEDWERVGYPSGGRGPKTAGFIPPPQACSPDRSSAHQTTATSAAGVEVHCGNWLGSVASALPGWFLTTLAIMLGAPFWFDVLNKLMVVRSTVKPREKSPDEASEDRQNNKPSRVDLVVSAK